jgi:hypothetical protein
VEFLFVAWNYFLLQLLLMYQGTLYAFNDILITYQKKLFPPAIAMQLVCGKLGKLLVDLICQ